MGVVGGQGAGEEVGGGAVEVVPVAVVAAGGAGVGVAEGVLDVLERGAEGEGFGGEGVPQAVWGDAVGGGEAGGMSQPTHLRERRLVRISAYAVGGEEERSAGAPVQAGVQGSDDRASQWYPGGLAALADDAQDAVAAVVAVVAGVGGEGLGDA